MTQFQTDRWSVTISDDLCNDFCTRARRQKSEIVFRTHNLPVYCVAVNADGESALVARIAQALNQDEHGWGLGIVEACIVAHHDIVVLDVDVGHFVRVEGRDERFICACQAAAQGLIAVKVALRGLQSLKLIALRRQVLQDATNLHDLGVAECLQLSQVFLGRAMSRVLDRLLD